MKKILSVFVGLFLLGTAACSKLDVQKNVSPEFPYESRFEQVLGSRMHYVEVGKGDPILFLHGNPTSSYLWRNVIPHLKPLGRVIAVDLIGMGKSDKPEIGYTFVEHSRYLEAFIKQKKLKNVTLVIHDWGSALGFHYAMRNESNVKGIAFMEAVTRPLKWSEFGFIEKFIFKRLRDPKKGPEMVLKENFFVEKMLPQFVAREMSKQEMDAYRAPYPTEKSRKPTLVWPNQIPIDGKPADVHALVSAYNAKLKTSNVPKLLLWAEPGVIIPGKAAADAIVKAFKNTEAVYIGHGKHFIQEDQPDNIGKAVAAWYKKINVQN